jgi:pyruvate formate lyase activating enzyme
MKKIDVATRLGSSVKGFLPITMLDWEGKVATVLFIGGCNFRCSFCHNPELVLDQGSLDSILFSDIKSYILNKKGWIDGVVVTGGEPTISPELMDILKEIKALEMPVKLDTNGSNPAILKEILSAGLADFVAMDIKTVFERYPEVTRTNIDASAIIESINLIIRFRKDHEFRTTAYPPAVAPDDLVEIARYLGKHGGQRYAIQQFKPDRVLSTVAAEVVPYRLHILEEAAEKCDEYIPTKVR